MKILEKYKKVVAALLVAFIVIVWLSFPNFWFHVFFAVTLAMVLGVFSWALYVIRARDKKEVKSIHWNKWLRIIVILINRIKKKNVVIPMEHNNKN